MIVRGTTWIAIWFTFCVWAIPALGAESFQAQDEATPPLPAGCGDGASLRSQFKPIRDVQIRLHPGEDVQIPDDCSVILFQAPRPDTARSNAYREVHWRPTNFFHQPLYFDDMPLERYGQTISPHWQPLISGARFFLTVPIVPYKIGVDRPYDCVTTLGLYRPGICAPCTREVLPHETDAALLQAGTALALVFLLP